MADPSTLPLSRLRAKLATPRGKRRIDALLSTDNPAAAVAELATIEVYELVHDVGFADALEFVALATPEQIRGCLDLDAWDRDHMQLHDITPWLSALVDAGHEKLARVWQRLDPELTALILARSTVIYDLSLGEEPDDADDRPVVLTPDTFFAVKLTAEDDQTTRLIHRIIDDLYRADPSGALARHTLMAARTEPIPELEEMSYRWRSGRLADMGYVEFYEALEVFRPLDPSRVSVGEGTEDVFDPAAGEAGARSLPLPIAERVVGKSFLARALDQIHDAAEIERLELALVVLVNKVLSAARVSPGHREAVDVGADHATATLALGLETVSQGDIDRAAHALRTVSLTRLHRVGHTVTLKLARLARALAPRAVTAGPPADALLAALLSPRPFFARELDTPPGTGPRPFESRDDLRLVAAELTKLTLRVAIANSLDVDLVALAHAPPPRPALDDHVRTALLRAMLGQPLSAAPLSPADLTRFQDQVLEDGTIPEAAKMAATRALLALMDQADITAAHEHLPALMAGWFQDLEDTIAPLPRPPDPRFIDRVRVATPEP